AITSFPRWETENFRHCCTQSASATHSVVQQIRSSGLPTPLEVVIPTGRKDDNNFSEGGLAAIRDPLEESWRTQTTVSRILTEATPARTRVASAVRDRTKTLPQRPRNL